MLHLNEIVIISGKVSEETDHSRDLEQFLITNNLHYKEVVGVYKGEEERSFLVVLPYNDYLNTMIDLGKVLKQECILYSSAMRESELIYQDGKREYIGQLVPVYKEEAMKQDCYTYAPDLNKYYITKKLK